MKKSQTSQPNLIAKRAWNLAVWAADELNAKVTVENPRRSYLWKYLDQLPQATSETTDVHLSACMFGAPYQKHTTLKCLNWNPQKLGRTCSLVDGTFSCGRSQEEGHVVLEFGQARTRDAAEYVPGLCSKWAEAIAEVTATDVAKDISLDLVELSGGRRAKRHCARGEDADTKKEVREAEDAASRAGMRNPADLEEHWQRLWEAMAPVRSCLEKERSKNPELKGLTKLCGETPSREWPSDALI